MDPVNSKERQQAEANSIDTGGPREHAGGCSPCRHRLSALMDGSVGHVPWRRLQLARPHQQPSRPSRLECPVADRAV
ncbi:hypothetical protein SRHO_G00149620 [Serrasalmus rhombeus]